MTNHPQTRRGMAIDVAVLDALRRYPLTATQLTVVLPGVSLSGARRALLRLQASGAVICRLDVSDAQFPKRVWKVRGWVAPLPDACLHDARPRTGAA